MVPGKINQRIILRGLVAYYVETQLFDSKINGNYSALFKTNMDEQSHLT